LSARYRLVVLCYHAVSDRWTHGLAVPLAAFERQLAAMRDRGYRPAPLDVALDPGAKGFHVTFDDAYRSVADALPALERAGAAATVFACTGYADANGAPLAIAELEDQVAQFPGELDTMDWDALRALVERGVDVQSHTVSHAHLTRLGDDELRRELAESKQRLEDELGRPCRFVAYPYGEDDARVHAAAHAAGYEAAFSLRGDARGTDRYALPRVDIYRKDTRLRFALKASPAIRAAALRLRG
jgi:peptidoglycan/xylan/chitin deacetylase (PgdA/CDA1 family)